MDIGIAISMHIVKTIKTIKVDIIYTFLIFLNSLYQHWIILNSTSTNPTKGDNCTKYIGIPQAGLIWLLSIADIKYL